jgi:maltose/moltooligosaccharide transporter
LPGQLIPHESALKGDFPVKKAKLSMGLLLMLALPPALLELLNNVYNLYVPIFLQAGNPTFAAKGSTLTLGFGLGALMVGFWMIADNIFGFFAQPLVGAWSDRTRSRRGRRLPFILYTLPFIVAGYALIPFLPTLIPPALNGQQRQLVGLFAFFILACVIYYLGFTPVRVVFQAMRQEAVGTSDRVKVESWFNFLLNGLTIIAYTAGALLYKRYGPLLFWLVLVLYIISALVVVFRYKEPAELSQAAEKQEKNNFKQLWSVFKDAPAPARRNLIFFLISVIFFTLGASAYTNFCSSWVVNVLKVNEASASNSLAIITVATTLAVLPAGYVAAGKFGRRNTYLVGIVILILAGLLISFMPKLYLASFILLGLGAGIGFPSQLPLASELAYKEDSLGSVIGIYNIAYLFGFVFGSFIIGWLIQTWSYSILFPAVTACMSAAAILFAFVRIPKATLTNK